MKVFLQVLLVLALISLYLLAAWAVLHPHVNQAYRAYYIDRTTLDWSPQRYPGSPEKGIDFVRPGLPDWVESTSGLSTREAGGRWTDGELAKKPSITFRREFVGPICIVINTQPGPSLVGKGFSVRMGNQISQFQFRSGSMAEYREPFSLTQEANRLEFEFPVELKRVSDFGDTLGDARRVGIFLSSLRIIPGDCSNSAQPLQQVDSQVSFVQKPTGVVCQGSIDEVDGSPPQPYETVAESKLSVNGWQAISGDDAIVPETMYVTLTDPDGKITYIKARSVPRADVKAYFNHPEMPDVGYEATADVPQLKGNYELGLARSYQGRLEICQNPKYPIRIEKTR